MQRIRGAWQVQDRGTMQAKRHMARAHWRHNRGTWQVHNGGTIEAHGRCKNRAPGSHDVASNKLIPTATRVITRARACRVGRPRVRMMAMMMKKRTRSSPCCCLIVWCLRWRLTCRQSSSGAHTHMPHTQCASTCTPKPCAHTPPYIHTEHASLDNSKAQARSQALFTKHADLFMHIPLFNTHRSGACFTATPIAAAAIAASKDSSKQQAGRGFQVCLCIVCVCVFVCPHPGCVCKSAYGN